MRDAEMCHLASSGRAQRVVCCGGAESSQGLRAPLGLQQSKVFFLIYYLLLTTLDLIIDDCTCVDPISCSAEADFSTERVPRAAAAVRSVAPMTVK